LLEDRRLDADDACAQLFAAPWWSAVGRRALVGAGQVAEVARVSVPAARVLVAGWPSDGHLPPARHAERLRLLGAAGWYGAATRLADVLLELATKGAAEEHRVLPMRLAETDALLHASWTTLQEAAATHDQACSPSLLGHGCEVTTDFHVARARLLVRAATTSVVLGVLPHEYEVSPIDPGAPAVREALVEWLGADCEQVDTDLVAGTLIDEGPSW
jgi:hypothetical protein